MLELKFEHLAGTYRLVDGPKIDFEAVPQEIYMEKPSASLSECLLLTQTLSQWIGMAETLPPETTPEPVGKLKEMATGLGQYDLFLGTTAQSQAEIRLLHYGSPFIVHGLIGGLSISGLGFLFYGAKRLFGADLEFLAYREQRRVEYLKAKQLAIELEEELRKENAHLLSTGPSSGPWSLTEGVVRDEQ